MHHKVKNINGKVGPAHLNVSIFISYLLRRPYSQDSGFCPIAIKQSDIFYLAGLASILCEHSPSSSEWIYLSRQSSRSAFDWPGEVRVSDPSLKAPGSSCACRCQIIERFLSERGYEHENLDGNSDRCELDGEMFIHELMGWSQERVRHTNQALG